MHFAKTSALMVMLAAASTPVSALAHAHLLGGDPAPNAQLKTSPLEIRARFSEPLVAAFSSLALATAKAQPVALGKATLSPSDAHELVGKLGRPLLPGDYVVSWRAVSADTHKTAGQYHFHVGP